jgi:hypothetical protein
MHVRALWTAVVCVTTCVQQHVCRGISILEARLPFGPRPCTTAQSRHSSYDIALPALASPCRFKVASKLGQGGFADVLCVKDAYANQQQAALKVLRPSPAACSGMCEAGRCSHGPAQAPEVSLFREARALKHAKHP